MIWQGLLIYINFSLEQFMFVWYKDCFLCNSWHACRVGNPVGLIISQVYSVDCTRDLVVDNVLYLFIYYYLRPTAMFSKMLWPSPKASWNFWLPFPFGYITFNYPSPHWQQPSPPNKGQVPNDGKLQQWSAVFETKVKVFNFPWNLESIFTTWFSVCNPSSIVGMVSEETGAVSVGNWSTINWDNQMNW